MTTTTPAGAETAHREAGAWLDRAREAEDDAVQRDCHVQAARYARQLLSACEALAVPPARVPSPAPAPVRPISRNQQAVRDQWAAITALREYLGNVGSSPITDLDVSPEGSRRRGRV
jgi:hypothetical protein